ncbi:MAG: hypothetical protein LBS83_02465 [Holosporales bacterium]|nr:hypothetical protein [Holosporales bacterium]
MRIQTSWVSRDWQQLKSAFFGGPVYSFFFCNCTTPILRFCAPFFLKNPQLKYSFF